MSRSPGSRWIGLVRDALPVALVALVVFQSIRTFAFEHYVVPSGSMEPTLFGDDQRGDIVLVNKMRPALGPPLHRHDMVVMRDRDDPDRHMVKRFVASGDEPAKNHVLLEGGDLWLGPGPLQLDRDVKNPLADRDLRISWFEYPARGDEDASDFLRFPSDAALDGAHRGTLNALVSTLPELEAALTADARRQRLSKRPAELHLRGHLATAQVVDTAFLDAEGRRRGHLGGALAVQDLGAELTFTPDTGCVGVQLVLELRPDYFSWSYEAGGQVRFLRNGRPVQTATAPALADERAMTVEFGFLDGHFFLIVEDRLLMHIPRPSEWREPPGPVRNRVAPENRLHVGVAGAGGARIDRLRVFRDIYYFRDPVPFVNEKEVRVPPGHLYLLGDNSFDSRDSRTRGSFPVSDVVGCPVMVLGPWSRLRWLAR